MMNFSANDLPSRSANRKIRLLLGRSYLREDRLDEALEVYLGLLAEEPGDGAVLLVLGNLYRLAGSLHTAACLYEQALAQDPGNPLIERQAALIQAEIAQAGLSRRVEEVEPLSAPAAARLAQRLRGAAGSLDRWEEIRAAADMLEKFSPEFRLDGLPGTAPESVQQLMPALIEMNIRQARATGRLDMAGALQSLQIHFRRKTGALNPDVLKGSQDREEKP